SFEHVHAGYAQTEDLRRMDRRPRIRRVELHPINATTAVDVTPELVAPRAAPHRGDDAASHDEGANVAPAALRDELLQEDVLAAGPLERLHDGLGDVRAVGEDDPDPLGAFEQLDDNRRAAHLRDGRQYAVRPPDDDRLRHPDAMTHQDLARTQL